MHSALLMYLSGDRPKMVWDCEQSDCVFILTKAGIRSCKVFGDSCAMMGARLAFRKCLYSEVMA